MVSVFSRGKAVVSYPALPTLLFPMREIQVDGVTDMKRSYSPENRESVDLLNPRMQASAQGPETPTVHCFQPRRVPPLALAK
jgi:hypothetical protein